MLKKVFSFVLVLALCLSLAACGKKTEPESESLSPTDGAQSKKDAYEPQRFETDTLTWDLDSKTGALSIHGEGPMRDYSQNAPEWAQHRDGILSLTVDDGVTSIGAYAFADLTALKEVSLPDSVEVIDVSAFDYAWELQSVNIPASLKYVGYRAFYNTMLNSPKDIAFPEGCKYIGDYAFHSALKTGGAVSFPSTLEYLGVCSFTNSVISDFTVSENNAFYRSEDHAVYTKDMKEMLMLAPWSEISGEFRVPDGVEKIDKECFNLIQKIEKVYIPSSVTEIPECAFFSTFALKEIAVDEANENYRSENGLLLSKDGTKLLAWPDGTGETKLVVPDGVERIGERLFYGRYDGPYTIVLPEGVKEIGTMSLPQSIASLTLPRSLEKIDPYVFYNGMEIEKLSSSATAAEWEKVVVAEGNDALLSTKVDVK